MSVIWHRFNFQECKPRYTEAPNLEATSVKTEIKYFLRYETHINPGKMTHFDSYYDKNSLQYPCLVPLKISQLTKIC